MPKRNRFRKKIKKSPKVFNDKSYGSPRLFQRGFSNLQYNQQQVYDSITKRFIAFYDDCLVANTTVVGKAADILFKTTGKEILKRDFV
jgi:DNA topoisomerase-3